MTDLQALPNIGQALADELRAVGIHDAESLDAVGAAAAAHLLAEAGLHDGEGARVLLDGALAGRAGAVGPSDPGRMPVLGVDNVLFAVADLDAALRHYVTGLGLELTFRLPDPAIALLRLGPETPGLLLREDVSVPVAAASVRSPRLWLEVPDALAAVDRIGSGGVVPLGEPFVVATGRVVEVADPWGNVVGFADYTTAPERGRAR